MRPNWESGFRSGSAQKWMAFFAGFAAVFVYLAVRNETECPYDAWTYTQCAESFANGGLFNLRAYAVACGDSMRGYLLPWILALCLSVSKLIPWLGYRFAVSVFASLTCTIALPSALCRIFRVKWMNAAQRLVPLALLMVFFNGLLAYPLSDVWGAGFAIAAVAALWGAMEPAPVPAARRLWLSLLAGFSFGAAYNIRTIYLFLLIGGAVALAALCFIRREIPLRLRLLCAACAAGGFLLVSLPQMLINHWVFGSATFMLLSKSGSNLFINQLYDGIYILKYESYTGVDYWYDGMNYVDAAGQSLLESEGMDATFVFGTGAQALGNLGAYAALVLRHPLDFIGIYARHLFSLLDIRYPNVFVNDFAVNPLLPLTNAVLLYFSGAAFCFRAGRVPEKSRGALWMLAVLLLPTAAILPGAIESRFGIVLFLTLWGCLSLCLNPKELKTVRGRSWALLALGCVAFVGVMCAFGGTVNASLLESPLLY